MLPSPVRLSVHAKSINAKWGFGNQKNEQNEPGGKWEVNRVCYCFQVRCWKDCVSSFLEAFTNSGLYNVVQREDAGDQTDGWKHLPVYYLSFPSFGNSLKKCSLILEAFMTPFMSSINDWVLSILLKPEVQAWFWVHVYLIFKLHSSVFLQTIINVQGYALPPEYFFCRLHESENSLCHLTGQYIAGTRLPRLEWPSAENTIQETLAPGWAIITVGSLRECDEDTPACTNCLWWAAVQKWLSTPSTISLLLRVAFGSCLWARQSSLGLP